MRDYTRTVIEKEWPAHKQGIALEDGDMILDRLENDVMNFEPTREREKIVHAEVLRSLDTVLEQRRLRLQAVSTGLPAAALGSGLDRSLLNGVLTYLFWVENFKFHALSVMILACFIALLIFLTAAMDNPFRGEFSVNADVFQTILEKVMKPPADDRTPAGPTLLLHRRAAEVVEPPSTCTRPRPATYLRPLDAYA